jgi:hypothetical protein
MERMVRAAWTFCLMMSWASGAPAGGFDHAHTAWAELLRRHVRPPLVDYAALKEDRGMLDRAVAAFASPESAGEPQWSREQRMAFWINAYNAFTLKAIVDHYPIRSHSIRRIDGVWTALRWEAAGRSVTLDEIEHRILRPVFGDARIHFAVNCASISCPPLAAQPYRAETLDAQLDGAARDFLASSEGLRREGDTLRVSSLFEWYGGDFVERFAPLVPSDRDPQERAILGVIAVYGPPAAAEMARTGRPAIEFLDWDWSLNDRPGKAKQED